MLSTDHAALEELSLEELRSTTGGCELICAISKGLGYVYQSSLELAKSFFTELLVDGPSLCYRTKSA